MKEENRINFVHMEDTQEVLEVAHMTSTNVILYGKGGYGKSGFSEQFFKDKGLRISVIRGHSGTKVEELTGIPNMDKLLNDSEFELAFNKSPFKDAEVLILEEFLDVQPEVSASLKDIISAGGLRTKTMFLPSDVKIIVMCTNKAPDEISATDSLNAFYRERFPIHHKVEWKNNPAKYYFDLLQANTALQTDEATKLSHICSRLKVSPRISMSAAKMVSKSGDFKTVKLINDFKNFPIDDILSAVDDNEEVSRFEDMIKDTLHVINKYKNNLGALLYVKDILSEFTTTEDVPDKRAGSFFTLLNSVNLRIKEIQLTYKVDLYAEIKNEIDEVFRNFKNKTT